MLTPEFNTERYIGHYTTITWRSKNWIEYNDMELAEKKIKRTNHVHPHILMYINNN